MEIPRPQDDRDPETSRRTAPLRRYVLVSLAIIILAWSLAQFGALRLLVERSYLQFEVQDGLTSARRLEGFMAQEYQRLLQISRDWGYWDDTLAFVNGTNPAYVEQNLDDATFENLAVDSALLGTSDGRLVYHWDAPTADLAPDSAAAVGFFDEFIASAQGRALLAGGREASGVIRTNRGLMAFAAVPILNNARKTRPAGVLLYGRAIDEELLREAKEHSIFDAELFLPGQAPWPPDIARYWAQRVTAPALAAQPLDARRLASYVLLRDHEGKPAGVMRTLTSRDTKQRFEQMARYLLGISLLLALLLAVAVVWVLERRVLAPLAAIGRVVNAVARSGELEARVPELARRDELAQLGREVNRMLGEIANQQSLRDARDSALAASAQKSEFLANMSHEIRTPMNGILGMLELVLETELSSQQQERIQTAYRSAEGLLSLLNDILDLSKLEAGKLTLERREFDLRELVENVVTLFAPNCLHKGIAISCYVQPGLGSYLGDPLRLQQVLGNLIGNAVKFTAHGEVTIKVTAGTDPGQLCFVIADTGIGIAPERLSQLFQPFVQVDSSMARRYGGTGLGLAICRQLIDRMSGTIDVASVPGNGTRFAVTLALSPTGSAGDGDSPAGARSYAGSKAIVCGPHDGTRAALSAYLGALGFEVRIEAQTADMNLRAAARPDLLVIDETLNGMAVGNLRAQALSLGVPLLQLANFNHSAPGRLVPQDRLQTLSKPVLFRKLCRSLERALRPASEPSREPARPSAVPGLRALAGRRVLLVEDNVVNQALALGMLETYEVVVDCAESGREALERLSGAPFELVLMDCQMPDMDGLEATRRWRAIERAGALPHVPIVALTANAMTGDREACLAAGMDDYLAKPFTRAELTRALQRWLGNENAEPAAQEQGVAVAG